MARVRQKGTDAELSLRRELHARGLRYRLQVPLLTKPRRVADIVFPRTRIAVFVDGCFWHGCPEHASWPKSNDRRLSASGWRVIRVWAHERPGEAAERIENVVRGGSGLQ
jgi:DNA mismatch endonuclease (patch repair protein)